jgi:hypothetical protein
MVVRQVSDNNWAPIEPQPEGVETPNGHHVAGDFDLSSLVSEPATSGAAETIPNPKAGKRSFRDWFFGKPKEKKVKVRKPTPPMPRKGIAGSLTNMYTGLGMTVAMVDKHCGMAIVESAEDCAQSWEDLAKTNPKVRRALLMLLETSDVTKIVIAHAPIMAAVMAHHMPLVREQQLRVVEMFANQGSSEDEGEE